MKVYTDRKPSWLQWISPDMFDDAKLLKIVIFFVFYSPCPNMSSMQKTLKEYNWNNPWKKPFYLNKQLKQLSSSKKLVFSASTYSQMDTELEKANLKNSFPSELSKERICVYDIQSNQFMSIFYHLRNALAHCRLNMVDVQGECVFILEDVCPGKNTESLIVSARMILKKSTLLKWIDLIEGGEKELKQETSC